MIKNKIIGQVNRLQSGKEVSFLKLADIHNKHLIHKLYLSSFNI